MKKIFFGSAAVALALMATTAFAVEADVPPSPTEAKIAEIEAKYAKAHEGIQREGKALNDEAPRPTELEGAIKIDFDVSWERTTIKLDVPEVKMKTREFKLHVPQFKMKTTSMKWDNPETFWAVTKVGEYPCFKGWKWYSCDIKTKVPQVRMVRREVKFDLPQVSWDKTSFKMDIPEFFTHRVEIKLHLPQFKAKNVNAQIKAHKDKADDLATKAENLAEAQKREVIEVVVADLQAKRSEIASQFDVAISSLGASITQVKAMGANPEAMVTDEGTQNLVAELQNLQAERAQALVTIDEKLTELSAPAAG